MILAFRQPFSFGQNSLSYTLRSRLSVITRYPLLARAYPGCTAPEPREHRCAFTNSDDFGRPDCLGSSLSLFGPHTTSSPATARFHAQVLVAWAADTT